MIVPGGGFSSDGSKWIACKPNFFLPVFVLSKLFRRLMLEKLASARASGKLTFLGVHAPLADATAYAKWLVPLRRKRWFVYAKEPFAGPKAVLAYLSRYTHRVAISNRRLITADASGVTFRVKNYRVDGDARHTTMALAPAEFIHRMLLHVLPKGFHRIRHTGFLASSGKAENIACARKLLAAIPPEPTTAADQSVMPATPSHSCPCCGGAMHIIETFERGQTPRNRAEPSRLTRRPALTWNDTS